MGLFGVALAWGIYDSTHDDDDDDAPSDDGNGTSTGQMISVEDGETVVAGAGDDTIVGGLPDDATPAVNDASVDAGQGDDLIEMYSRDTDIQGGAGDDTITGSAVSDTVLGGSGDDVFSMDAGNSVVRGGAGNDLLDVTGGNATIHGGSGDDTLSGGDRAGPMSEFYGDAGDDLLQLDFGEAGSQQPPLADGGIGDDTLQVSVSAPYVSEPSGYFGAPRVTGGEGSDLFEVDFRPEDNWVDLPNEPRVLSSLDITDFDPSQDRLVVDPNAGGDPMDFLRMELHENDFGTEVRLFYANPDGGDYPTDEKYDIIRLVDAHGVTADDIALVAPGTDALARFAA